jgi:hypothetical protein
VTDKKKFSRSHDAVIRVYDQAGNVTKRTSIRQFPRVLRSEQLQPRSNAHPIIKEILSKGFHPHNTGSTNEGTEE